MSTKIKAKKDYTPAPEYQGVAVCVDVTEPQERETKFGLREEIRLIFEIPLEMEDGRRYTVRTAPMTTSLGEKANLRKFIRNMRGRDLRGDELKEFDLDTLIGQSVNISIIHEEIEDGRIFDQIALCQPWKGTALEPSGDYVRKNKKRKPESDDSSEEDSGGTAKAESTYRRAESGGTKAAPSDHGLIKVHVGKHQGIELRDLTKEAIQLLIDHWLTRDFPKIAKPTADDRRLCAALETYKKKFSEAQSEPEEPEDDVPY